MFYLVLSIVMLAGVLVGFGPTFFLRPSTDAALPTLLVVHGVVLTAWYVVLPLQAWLVFSGRRRWHRPVGWFAAALAAAIVVTTVPVTIGSVARGLQNGLTEVQIGFVVLVNVLRIPFFGFAVAVAIVQRRRRDVHARALLWASLSNFAPAVARAGALVGVHPVISAFAYLVPFGAAMIVHDRATLGRTHVVTWWGLVALLAIMIVPILLLFAGAAPWVVDALK